MTCRYNEVTSRALSESDRLVFQERLEGEETEGGGGNEGGTECSGVDASD